MRNIVLIGASRGLGAALAAEFSNSGDRTWLLSRTELALCHVVAGPWHTGDGAP